MQLPAARCHDVPMHTNSDDQLRSTRERLLACSAESGQIERALERLETGTYGACETCGAKIESERLSVVPCAAVCRRCAPGG